MMRVFAFAAAATLALPALATPEAPGPFDPDYAACVARLGNDIAEARRAAETWRAEGGGAPALHCLALADLAAGYPKLAAIRFEELAERADAGDNLIRARIMSQAALAWLDAGETALAAAAVEAAFKRVPDAAELFLPAALVHFASGRNEAAVEAVTRAESEGFVSVEGFVTRGKARRALGRHREAADDVVAALSLDPLDIDALTLRGDLVQSGIVVETRYRRSQ